MALSAVRELSPPRMSLPAERPSGTLSRLWRWAWDGWATRSLAVGAVATAMDVLTLEVVVRGLGMPNPTGTALGVVVGGAFTFFANRHFAFRDHRPSFFPQAIKFLAAIVAAMPVHILVVWFLADRNGLPVEIAKLIADIAVFSVGQLVLLRFLIFPKYRPPDVSANAEPAEEDEEDEDQEEAELSSLGRP